MGRGLLVTPRRAARSLKVQHGFNIMVKFETPVKCAHCPYKFNNNRALIEHMDSEHESEPKILSKDNYLIEVPNKTKVSETEIQH